MYGYPMSPVDFKKLQYLLSLFLSISNGPMSPVKFKKRQCRPFKFKGRGPQER